MTAREVHPVARLFPLLGEPELRALADDVRANGLKVPIVLCDGQVLDGRNRLAACQLAGVEPSFVDYRGTDQSLSVWSGDGRVRAT